MRPHVGAVVLSVGFGLLGRFLRTSFRPPLVLAILAATLLGFSFVVAEEDLWSSLNSGRVLQANYYQTYDKEMFAVYAYPAFLTAPRTTNVPIFAKMTGRTEGGGRILILSDGPDFSERGNQLQLAEKEHRQLYAQDQQYSMGRPLVVYARTTSTYSMADLLADPRILGDHGFQPEDVSQLFQTFLERAQDLENEQTDQLMRLTKEDLGMEESSPDGADQRLHATYEKGMQIMKTVELGEDVKGVVGVESRGGSGIDYHMFLGPAKGVPRSIRFDYNRPLGSGESFRTISPLAVDDVDVSVSIGHKSREGTIAIDLYALVPLCNHNGCETEATRLGSVTITIAEPSFQAAD